MDKLRGFFKSHTGITLFLTGLLFNLLESLWFGRGTEMGFNPVAMSTNELACDYLAIAMMVVGFLLGIKDAMPRAYVAEIKFVKVGEEEKKDKLEG